ncbi:phosphonate metabolism protein PhnP [Advenella alkanexedens]|uniref:Phosphonate metabolism protein PhnP n=1 Tax=Advenella alkanexedens TaxID=1481665 RepID=A0ABS6NQZ2_9BURK|nr:phosphonate metabolism protein PhnP [Advenella alkanexedens]MBV4398060.1 phosphonate metabolism protein PhnP [Advenella alkanexedens]
MKLTFLGTGDTAQVPVYNCQCPACQRAGQDARFVRKPSSVLVQSGAGQWLVDSGHMDLCQRFAPGTLSGILQTHYHADHAQGLLHLRWGVGLRIPVHGPFDEAGFADLYKHPGILDFSQPFAAFETRQLGAQFQVTALPLVHSKPCFGYFFEEGERRIAYLTDTVGLGADTYAFLKQRPLDYCIVDCSHPPRDTPPRNHNDLNTALKMCEGLAIGVLLLTHIGHEMDNWLINNPDSLPANVKVARDGQVLTV